MISLALALFLQAATQGDPPPPDPEIERKSFKVAEGFEVTLFAADPLVAKPIQMNFDARGRLWISTSSIYPMVVPGEIPESVSTQSTTPAAVVHPLAASVL